MSCCRNWQELPDQKDLSKKCDEIAFAEDEEHGQRMRRRLEAVGDSKSVQGFLERMVTLHGEGGTEKTKRRLARSSVFRAPR